MEKPEVKEKQIVREFLIIVEKTIIRINNHERYKLVGKVTVIGESFTALTSVFFRFPSNPLTIKAS